MIPLQQQSLRRQILTVTGILLVLLTGAAAWSSNRTRIERQLEVRQEALSMSTIAAAYLNQYLDSLDALAAALARHPAVIALNRLECDRVFADVLRNQPLLLNVVLRSPDGAIRASGAPAADGAPGAPMPPFAEAVFETKAPVMSDLFRGIISGQPTLARGYPVFGAGGSIIGAIGFGLNLGRLQDVFSKVELPSGSIIAMFDSTGQVISRNNELERYIGTRQPGIPSTQGDQHATELRTGLDGVPRFYSDTRIARGGWVVSVGIPRAEVLSRLGPLYRRNVAILLSAVLVVVAVALFLSQHTSRGLNRLREAAQRIADGDFSPPQPGPAPNFEIGQLQHAFTTMAANLRDAREALAEQIEQERRMRGVLQSLQMQVVRQERLAAVGLLVSGVAHELNNPLQGILGTAELLERAPGLAPETRDEIVFIKTQSGRAREIIRNLSRFSRQQSGPPSFVDLRDVVAEVVQLRHRDLENATMTLDIDIRSSRKVLANFTEIEQVVLNFVINAQQAIESTGRAGGRIIVRVSDAGKRVRLDVEDNGPGVREEHESKLFQPFFTTKPVGVGTGLGLSVSYGIIDSYGGAIGHTRNPRGGATFFFELPAAESEAG